MARLTVEKIKVDNRYEMILLAAHRAKNLEFGAQPLIDLKDKKVKNALLALMEIEAGKIDIDELRKHITHQGENSLKTTEIVQTSEQQNNRNSENLKATQSSTDISASKDAAESIIYKDEENIED